MARVRELIAAHQRGEIRLNEIPGMAEVIGVASALIGAPPEWAAGLLNAQAEILGAMLFNSTFATVGPAVREVYRNVARQVMDGEVNEAYGLASA